MPLNTFGWQFLTIEQLGEHGTRRNWTPVLFEIRELLRDQVTLLQQILLTLETGVGQKPAVALKFSLSQTGALLDGQKITYTVIAVDATGNETTLTGGATVTVQSSNPAAAVVTQDQITMPGFLASGSITGAASLGTVAVNASTLNPDGSAGPQGIAQVTIVAGLATKLVGKFGKPIQQ